MFGRKRAPKAVIRTLVGAETRVLGDVEFSGGFLVDGYVKGDVRAAPGGGGVLNVTEGGYIEGAVTVPNVVLHGTVKGDVTCAERVELGPKARVMGNVQYKLIEMAIGAEVNGKLIHDSDSRQDKGEQGGRARPASVRPVNAVGE